jgi:hypothetical protein
MFAVLHEQTINAVTAAIAQREVETDVVAVGVARGVVLSLDPPFLA